MDDIVACADVDAVVLLLGGTNHCMSSGEYIHQYMLNTAGTENEIVLIQLRIADFLVERGSGIQINVDLVLVSTEEVANLDGVIIKFGHH